MSSPPRKCLMPSPDSNNNVSVRNILKSAGYRSGCTRVLVWAWLESLVPRVLGARVSTAGRAARTVTTAAGTRAAGRENGLRAPPRGATTSCAPTAPSSAAHGAWVVRAHFLKFSNGFPRAARGRRRRRGTGSTKPSAPASVCTHTKPLSSRRHTWERRRGGVTHAACSRAGIPRHPKI